MGILFKPQEFRSLTESSQRGNAFEGIKKMSAETSEVSIPHSGSRLPIVAGELTIKDF